MFDWEDLRHFAALAQEGSLSAAARALQVEHATVARRVAGLEAALGLKLVDRRPRSYALTGDGQRIAAIAGRVEAEILAIERVARAGRKGLVGEVSLSAPPAMLRAVIVRHLAALKVRHPGIRIDLIAEKRLASLARREADIAVRLSRPEGAGLVARRIGSQPFRLYAAAGYLSVRAPADYEFIAHEGDMAQSPQQQWLAQVVAGRRIVMRSADADVQLAAVLAGIGVAVLPSFLADGQPGLVAVPAGMPDISRDIWLVVHEDLQRSPIVRAVLDHLASAFA
ncbi:LysR family transcriptional regulator [Dongia sp.]|uniref:LysR family transcriptional regulator n=1 Tax=Dongia sp. TaxID=1977262 RepID=UPI0035AD7B7C